MNANFKRRKAKQAESGCRPKVTAGPLPPILSLREFVEKMEREYGPSMKLEAIKAAL